jgi:sec-independent protein translocase protein TatB
MFDIGWTELLVIAVVAIVVIGPKDLPRVMRTVGQWTGKLKRMSRQFQNQFNEALREAELDNVRRDVEAISKEVREEVAKAGESIKKAGADIDKGMAVSEPPAVQTPAEPAPVAAAAPPAEAQASVAGPVGVAAVPQAEPAAAAAGEVKP